jgi:adenosyl cobinamide kinase/adenosyl cobinamide phosphate guanylyltransferase
MWCCNDVCSAIEAVEHQHNTTEKHLFIDCSTVWLKAVLLHNGNKFPSVPLDHVANTKESCDNMKVLLENIQYEKYNLKI